MLKIKSIKKDGKYLTIIIKKPCFMSLKKFMDKHNLFLNEYSEDIEYNYFWGLTVNGDVQLDFVLRSYEDMEPYLLKPNDICKEIAKEINKKLKEKPQVSEDGTVTIKFDKKYSKGQKKMLD